MNIMYWTRRVYGKVLKKLPEMDLTRFHLILISTSAGKDSQAMSSAVVSLAIEQGVLHRVVAVHADLGRVEWQGCVELAQTHSDMLNIPLIVVDAVDKHGNKLDLLQHVKRQGKWPGMGPTQYCTSDHKRGPINKVITAANETFRQTNPGEAFQVLNCIGYRADESGKRLKKVQDEGMLTGTINKRMTNKSRTTLDWAPIGEWTTQDVWAEIRDSGLPHHFAYDLGMPRLSCAFCIYANHDQLLLAGKHNPELLDEYVALEAEIDHAFTQDSGRGLVWIKAVKADLVAGVEPNLERLAVATGGGM